MDSQRKAFEEALKADPYDKDTRLVYADWLEEHGTLPSDDDLARFQREWTREKHDARIWLDSFVEELNEGIRDRYEDYPDYGPRTFPLDADGFLKAAKDYLDNREYVHLSFDTPDLLYEKREEFWKNYFILTGGSPKDTDRLGMFFSCSC